LLVHITAWSPGKPNRLVPDRNRKKDILGPYG
jgi:hypothetical protein